MKEEYYRKDLAFIHDVGHAEFALKSAPGILRILRQCGINNGLVVDLGCGSGLLARELVEARYEVLGVDISESMITLARRRVPRASFRVGSLYRVAIPSCVAVTSIGECFNYQFDSAGAMGGLRLLFRRIYRALNPGGLLVFDVAGPRQTPDKSYVRTFTEGDGWVVLVERVMQQRFLTRRITSFRKTGQHYRRDHEVHRQRLFKPTEVAAELRRAGFRVRTMRSYGEYALPKNHRAFVARKPLNAKSQNKHRPVRW